jgi:hypothetical protein
MDQWGRHGALGLPQIPGVLMVFSIASFLIGIQLTLMHVWLRFFY